MLDGYKHSHHIWWRTAVTKNVYSLLSKMQCALYPFPISPFPHFHFRVPKWGAAAALAAHLGRISNHVPPPSLESFDSLLYTGPGGPPSSFLPASLHLALLELVTSGFCSAVLRFVKCEVRLSLATDLLTIDKLNRWLCNRVVTSAHTADFQESPAVTYRQRQRKRKTDI